MLCELDAVLNSLKDYNGKEIKKEKEGFDIDVMLYDLNEYIDGLNKDEKLTNSLVFGVIKSVIEDFRKEYYNTIGIDINEEKDVSKNEIEYFDKYLNGEKDRMEDIYKRVSYVVLYGKSSTTFNIKEKCEIFNEFCNEFFNKINISKKTQEQQEVYFEEDEESLKTKSSSSNSFSSSSSDDWSLLSLSSLSEDYTSAIENMEEVSNKIKSESETEEQQEVYFNDEEFLKSKSSSSNSFSSSSSDDWSSSLSSSSSEDYTFVIEDMEEVVNKKIVKVVIQ